MPNLYSDVVLTSAFQQLILELGLTRLTLYVEQKSDLTPDQGSGFHG